MADHVMREGQKHHSVMQLSAKGHIKLGAGAPGHTTLETATAPERVEVAVAGAATGARTVTRITPAGSLGNMYVRVDLAQPSAGNHAAYVHQAIARIRILAGSTEIWAAENYPAAWQAMHHYLPPHISAGVALAATSAGANAAASYALPIMAPWTIFGVGTPSEDATYTPLPCWRAADPSLSVEVTFGSDEDAWTANAGATCAISGAAIVFTDFIADRSALLAADGSTPMALMGYEYQGLPDEAPGAQLAATRYDLTAVAGTIAAVIVHDTAGAWSDGGDVASFSSGTVTVDKVTIDGRTLATPATYGACRAIESAMAGFGRAGDLDGGLNLDLAPVVPFSVFPKASVLLFSGGLATADVRNLEIVLSSSAAVGELRLVAVTHTLITLDAGGRFTRRRV